MRDMAAFEIRRLHRKHAQVDRRLGLVDISGKVKPGSQDMQTRTVILLMGKGADGTDVESPRVRWQGTASGDFRMHAAPADNEQMILHSPSGTIGSASMAHWGTYDQDHQPPSQSKDEAVLQFADGRITFGKQSLTVAFGSGGSLVLTKDKATLALGDLKIVLKDGKVFLVKEDASDPVMLESGPSQKLFGVP